MANPPEIPAKTRDITTDTCGKPRIPIDGASNGTPLEYALRYAALGWRVFPCHSIADGACTCRDPQCASPGKHPIRQLVQDGLKSASTKEELIRAWWHPKNAPWANVGVRTGPESGFWVLDVDPLKGGEDSLDNLLATHGGLPDTAEAITGSGGRHILFTYPPDKKIGSSTNKLGPGLDIRGEGGYIIAEPSLHISGQAYIWEAASDPLEGVELVAAPEWIINLVEGPASLPSASQIASGNAPMLSPLQVLELRNALGYLNEQVDDYTTMIKVGMALHSTGAPNAFGLWNEWCQASEKYDGLGAKRKKWASFSDRPGDLGVSLTTIFALAQAEGWINPACREAQEFNRRFEESTGYSFAELEKVPQKIEVVAPPKHTSDPWPVTMLDQVEQWISATAPISCQRVSQQAVLSLVSAATARRYRTPQGEPTSLYLGVVSRSVGELRFAHQAVFQIMRESGLRRMVRNTRIPSPASLYRSLMRSPALLYQSDDYGGLVAFARRQPSGVQESLLSLLAQIHGGQDLALDHIDEAGIKATALGDQQPIFYSPSVTLLALIGQDQLVTLLRTSELGRGALEQMLLAIADGDDVVGQEPTLQPIPPILSTHLCTLRGVPQQPPGIDLDPEQLFSGNAGLQPNLITVQFPSDMSPYYAPLDLSQDRALRPVLTAARGHVRRIAAALAAWQNPNNPVADGAICSFAARYVSSRIAELLEQYEVLHGDDGKLSIYDQVLTKVIEAKQQGIPRRALTQGCWAFRNLSSENRGKLLELMLSDESIYEIEVKNGNRTGKRLVAAKFIKQVTK